jgi:hypothetical protein
MRPDVETAAACELPRHFCSGASSSRQRLAERYAGLRSLMWPPQPAVSYGSPAHAEADELTEEAALRTS